jgi:hypothetical protein
MKSSSPALVPDAKHPRRKRRVVVKRAQRSRIGTVIIDSALGVQPVQELEKLHVGHRAPETFLIV